MRRSRRRRDRPTSPSATEARSGSTEAHGSPGHPATWAGSPSSTASPSTAAASCRLQSRSIPADLAADQLAAVAHRCGRARVIAPAGSRKTRGLSERLAPARHRGVEPARSSPSPTTSRPSGDAGRTTDFRPHVRTLNSLAWGAGGAPRVVAASRRRARRAPHGGGAGARPGAACEHRSDRPLRRGAGVDPSRSPRPRGCRVVARRCPGPRRVLPAFRFQLAERGVVDFDEQIYAAVESLLRDGEFRSSMQRSCRHLLVDEFQDLTPAHVLLIRLLALPALDVFGVGDDDQCIYGHAGADPGFLIDYGRLFPVAAEHALERELPLSGRGRRRRSGAARLQRPPSRQADRGRPGQRPREGA